MHKLSLKMAVEDLIARLRARGTETALVEEFFEEHVFRDRRRKLTPAVRERVAELVQMGYGTKVIAREVGISVPSARKIMRELGGKVSG
jgi:hypothetical protein